MKREDLFKKAKSRDISILSDPDVSKIKNKKGDTPLHVLAFNGALGILKHVDVSKVKNDKGETPLHILSNWRMKSNIYFSLYPSLVENNNLLEIFLTRCALAILRHPDIVKVRDNEGATPLHYLARSGASEYVLHSEADTITDNNGNTPKQYYNITVKEGVHKFTNCTNNKSIRDILHLISNYVSNDNISDVVNIILASTMMELVIENIKKGKELDDNIDFD
ncbi:MAG: hypothetical protein ACOC2W_04845 [bacterium]